MEDLDRVLAKQKQIDIERRTKEIKNRRFIVCEGLYQSMGDIAPLAKIVELRHRVCIHLLFFACVLFRSTHSMSLLI
jgi:7-keto-8-aminopelargonate synthetase-like enzyme